MVILWNVFKSIICSKALKSPTHGTFQVLMYYLVYSCIVRGRQGHLFQSSGIFTVLCAVFAPRRYSFEIWKSMVLHIGAGPSWKARDFQWKYNAHLLKRDSVWQQKVEEWLMIDVMMVFRSFSLPFNCIAWQSDDCFLRLVNLCFLTD